MNTVLVPCIIAGGSGTRLWPVSRETMPKPFIRLPDGDTLLQKTIQRILPLANNGTLLTVLNRELVFRFLDDYRDLQVDLGLEMILEPFGRNTAAAALLSALRVRELHGEQALLLILPADHLIREEAAFLEAVEQAKQLAVQGHMVTFGLQPDYPETGYGYIKKGQDLSGTGFKVAEFLEKPALEDAERFVSSGDYFWNSGMFCMRADVLLEEAQRYAPDLLQEVEACWAGLERLTGLEHNQVELRGDQFAQVTDISIDVALMERSDKVAVVPCQLGWSDIGSWKAMCELTPATEDGNRIFGEVLLHDVQNCYIDSPSRLTAAVGVEDLIIVDTPDALLVAHEGRTQDVKVIANRLKDSNHAAYYGHVTTIRPWGVYTVLNESARYKIKRIVVKPQATLSLQSHHHRSEHWIVVSGAAQVVNGDESYLLSTNESTFIRAGEKHRLSNPGVIDLVLIEVQSGDYLGEDDIVRYDDIYGRTDSGDEA